MERPPCGCSLDGGGGGGCPLLPDWLDDERMGFLFAPFGEEVNAEAAQFWRAAVAHVWGCSDAPLTMTAAALEARFERKGVTPMGLRRVLAETMAADVVPAASVGPTGLTRRLLAAVVVRPALWAWGKVAAPPDPLQGDLVLRPALAAAADAVAVLAAPLQPSERVLPLTGAAADKALGALARREGLSSADLAVLRSQLLEAGQAASSPADNVFKLGARSVDASDTALLRLRTSEEALRGHLRAVEAKALAVKGEALALKRAGNTPAAVLALRRLKRLQETETNFRGAMANVHAALDSLEAMHSDAAVVAAYGEAAEALRSTREGLGLSAERVEDAQEALQAEMDQQEEISSAISSISLSSSSSSSSLDLEDDEELLAELAALEAASAPSAPSAPSVPSVSSASSVEAASAQTVPAEVGPSAEEVELAARMAALKLPSVPVTVPEAQAQAQAQAAQPEKKAVAM